MSNDTTVVIATYNEARTIRQVLDGLRAYYVILVDDNSPDCTGMIANEYLNVRVITRPEKSGVASAYVLGLREAVSSIANAYYVVQMDAGMTHDPADVPRLVERLEATCADLVIGSRFVQLPRIRNYRTALSLCAAGLMQLLGVQVYDATSGFRCWRASLLRGVLSDWEPKATGFAFQLEMLYRAWMLCHGRVVEVPIEYRLTNSSFRWWMLAEALRVYARLWLERGRRYG
jgi:dolichol-phosphate mannosyltransferase